MYRAQIADDLLQAQFIPAYNFDSGSFTVIAMVAAIRQPGAVVARMDGSRAGAGFALQVLDHGRIGFTVGDGTRSRTLETEPTSLSDGRCHTIAAIYEIERFRIVLDGEIVHDSPNEDHLRCADNSLPLTIGGGFDKPSKFSGDVMNVSLWAGVVVPSASDGSFTRAEFARVTGVEPNLRGYWTLDGTTEDLSPNNNPAEVIGKVAFAYCLDCVWVRDHSICRISNMPAPGMPSTTVTMSGHVVVRQGQPVLAMAIMADQDIPAFPAGAQVTLVDPSGTVYNQDQSTDKLFAAISDGQLWSLMVIDPKPGTWRVTVTAPSSTAFWLNLHAITQYQDRVVEVCRNLLDPLFASPDVRRHVLRPVAVGGFSDGDLGHNGKVPKVAVDAVSAVAVGAVTGVIVTALSVGKPSTAVGGPLPFIAAAVVAGIAFFANLAFLLAKPAAAEINPHSLADATIQIAGMSGFIVAVGKILLLDANCEKDPVTRMVYSRRSKRLYPAVDASPFNKVQVKLVAADMKYGKVKDALNSFATGYVSACGHGKPSYLAGYYASGNDGPLDEVLVSRPGKNKFSANEVNGKIFHFFACYTGTTGDGFLGQSLVASGAAAFFGYNNDLQITASELNIFCDCDIAIDKALLDLKSCDEAYNDSIALCKKSIATFRANGDDLSAARLEHNMNALVAPSTNRIYGDKTARLVRGYFQIRNRRIVDFGDWLRNSSVVVITGDFNGDGLTDIALVRVGESGWKTQPVAFSNGDGTFNVTNQPLADFANMASNSGVQVITGDFNGNGRTDIALVRLGKSGWTTQPVAFSNGDGNFTVTNKPIADFADMASNSGVQVITGDFNGDGRTDIALVRVGESGWTTQPVAFSSGNGTFTVTNQPLADFANMASNSGVQVITGDFNGDGRTDIALVRVGESGWTTQPVAFSNGDGTFNATNQPLADFANMASNSGVQVITGDFNGDGRTDIALVRVGEVGWTTQPVAFSNGDGTFTVKNEPLVDFANMASNSGVRVITGDFNGNGRTDIALVGGVGWTTIAIAFSNGDGTFEVSNIGVDVFASWAQQVPAYVGRFCKDAGPTVALVGSLGWDTMPLAVYQSGIHDRRKMPGPTSR